MVNRWLGIATFALMLSANAALLVHDVFPAWFAGNPPRPDFQRVREDQDLKTQFGIYNDRGQPVGKSWTVAARSGTIATVRTRTRIEALTLSDGMTLPPITLSTDCTYQIDAIDQLDDLKVELRGLDFPVVLKGEFVPPDEFPCVWQLGEQRGRFVMNAAATRALGDVVRPFTSLPDLYVGRTWRVALFDPLRQLLPGWQDDSISTRSVLVRVTAQESIMHRGATIETFRVESEATRAWVDATGRVIRQEIELPLLGRWVLVDEPFDEDAHRRSLFHPLRFGGGRQRSGN